MPSTLLGAHEKAERSAGAGSVTAAAWSNLKSASVATAHLNLRGGPADDDDNDDEDEEEEDEDEDEDEDDDAVVTSAGFLARGAPNCSADAHASEAQPVPLVRPRVLAF